MTPIRFDECINWRIVDAIEALTLPDGVILETPHRRNERGHADVDWIEDFATRGGRLVVSGDANMRRMQLERAALEASGLRAVFPWSMDFFSKLRKWGQAAYLTAWLPAIVRLAQEAEPGTHVRLPNSFTGDFDSLVTLRSLAQIDAEREAKRAAYAAAKAENGEE